jgi:hypothetical protein
VAEERRGQMQDVEPVTAEEDMDTPVRFAPDAGAQTPPGRRLAKPTGEPSVDAMIARLDGLDGLPLDEHVAVFEDTHAGLRQVLSELDAAPDAPAGQQGTGPRPGPGGR